MCCWVGPSASMLCNLIVEQVPNAKRSHRLAFESSTTVSSGGEAVQQQSISDRRCLPAAPNSQRISGCTNLTHANHFEGIDSPPQGDPENPSHPVTAAHQALLGRKHEYSTRHFAHLVTRDCSLTKVIAEVFNAIVKVLRLRASQHPR